MPEKLEVCCQYFLAAALLITLASCANTDRRPHASVPAEPVQESAPTQKDSGIQATQAPGQYDVLVGTAVQLRAQAQAGNRVLGYRWEIVEGQGGTLLNAESAVTTFVARQIPSAIETFVIHLTTDYATGKPSSADMIVRVHRQAPARSSPAPARQGHHSPWLYGSLGFGMGYIWNYPIYVPIVVPPPDEIWPPEKIPPVNPEPLPPEEIERLPEDLHPPELLPPDAEFPDAVPLPEEASLDTAAPLSAEDILDNPVPIIEPVEQPNVYPTDPDPPEAGSDWGFREDFGDDVDGDFGDGFDGGYGDDF